MAFDDGGADECRLDKQKDSREETHERRKRAQHGKAETNGREHGMNLPLGYDLNQLML